MSIVVGYVRGEQAHKPVERAPSPNQRLVSCVLGDEFNLAVCDLENAPLRNRRTAHVARCVTKEMSLRYNLVDEDDPTGVLFTAVNRWALSEAELHPKLYLPGTGCEVRSLHLRSRLAEGAGIGDEVSGLAELVALRTELKVDALGEA
jgi:hypothetical protein